MTAHLSDSDRQALRLAHDLREELRRALPQQAAAPSVSPFVDPAGRPSVLMRMDAETARALMAVIGERRFDQPAAAPEGRRADGTVPPPGQPYAGGGPYEAGPPVSAMHPMQPVHPVAAPPGYTTGPQPLLPTAFPGR
ncbi:hypothetical protein [Actinomadura parmotrematis]|uniref:Uncharacterized protein n=1 Tax=Actinomadura parmotrematis TaxID=2864039 RepID=A0ABS7G098_9ACTN|nr:hypothetical protein [Actinomadura parmotrematis]MBW8486133.1 hypothetical protein [Actinomadura parmotrematis]